MMMDTWFEVVLVRKWEIVLYPQKLPGYHGVDIKYILCSWLQFEMIEYCPCFSITHTVILDNCRFLSCLLLWNIHTGQVRFI